VTLKVGVEPTDTLKTQLRAWVRQEIGPFAAPDLIQFAPGLPKTRSGKIMRRILRKIAEDDLGSLGDTSTLADPAVVDDLVKNRAARRHDDDVVIDGATVSVNDVEATLICHPAVSEAAVVPFQEPGKGLALWAFVTLEAGEAATDVLGADLKGFIRREMSPQAAPRVVQFATALPKTRAGDLVRPVLRRIAESGEPGDLGDVADAASAQALAQARAAALA
jgi:acetyl-CoA synthetase